MSLSNILINYIFMGTPGIPEIILIILAILLLFGGKKIPELMKGLGKGMKEFKKAKEDIDDTSENETKKPLKDE